MKNIKEIKEEMDKLMIKMLEIDPEEQVFNEDDLMNASFIFMTTLSNISASYCIDQGMTAEQSYTIAEEAGNNFNQTILLSTGIDMKKVADKGK